MSGDPDASPPSPPIPPPAPNADAIGGDASGQVSGQASGEVSRQAARHHANRRSSEPSGDGSHVPVLADAVSRLLDPRPGLTLLDCTVGRGGHAGHLGAALAPGGRVIGLDVDPGNADAARRRLTTIAGLTVHVEVANFSDAPAVLARLDVAGVDRLLADLGFSSNQMDDPARGLAFSRQGPLDMRLDPSLAVTAADLVNDLHERELADLIYQFGEERLSRRIARKIVESRRDQPIQTTSALADLVARCYGPAGRRHRIHPATRTFMALRIAVNGELDALASLLEAIPGMLRPGGVAAVISFHSLEDRMVKHRFRQWADQGRAERLTRKPVSADADEAARNPRSRSAKLRAIRWMAEAA